MSFVRTLLTDSGIIENPTWDDVERAIKALDARTETLVSLSPPSPLGPPVGEHHMCIGGGKDNQFVVYMTEDNLSFWNLVDHTRDAGSPRVNMLIGGQEGDYSARQCSSREAALLAAREYFNSGGRATGLTWELDGDADGRQGRESPDE